MHYPQQAPLGASSPHNPLQIPRRHRASRSFLQAAGPFHGRPHRHSSIWSPSRRIDVRLSLPRRQFWFSSWLCSTVSCSRAISSRVGSSVLSPSASCCWQPASPLTSPPVAGFSAAKRSCPAGRASYAESGHFVACVPCRGRYEPYGPRDARDEQHRRPLREGSTLAVRRDISLDQQAINLRFLRR